jgi:murein DD-endopeptidase MepM/ murein hydrolase activator NlpD
MKVRSRPGWSAAGAAVLTCMLAASCTTQTAGTTAAADARTTPAAVDRTPAPDPAKAGPSVLTPVVAAVLAPPVPVTGTDERVHLAYELVLTNTYAHAATITSVTVRAGEQTLQRLRGADLTEVFRVTASPDQGRTLAPGQQGIVWVDATVSRLRDVPDRLQHVVHVRFAEPTPPIVPQRLAETVADAPVQGAEPVVIRPPLSGPRWVDANGCCALLTPHRSAVSPLDGALWAPERYAVDFVQLDPRGRLFDGPQNERASYAYYGAPVSAVADGPVVTVVDDLEEQTPGADPTGLRLDEFGGNHVVQDIGGGRYAFYAHLQRGATEGVAAGQELSAGDLVGRLGNTGNTDAPHLHFHVMDSPDPLASNGLPFVVDTFDLEARIGSADDIDAIVGGAPAEYAPAQPTGPRAGEMPLFLDVLTFPAGS